MPENYLRVPKNVQWLCNDKPTSFVPLGWEFLHAPVVITSERDLCIEKWCILAWLLFEEWGGLPAHSELIEVFIQRKNNQNLNYPLTYPPNFLFLSENGIVFLWIWRLNSGLVCLGACLAVKNSSLSIPLRLYYYAEKWVVCSFTLLLANSQQIPTDVGRWKKHQQMFSWMMNSIVFKSMCRLLKLW